MPIASRFEGDVHVNGTLSMAGVTLPAGGVAASNIAANAGIESSKVVHRHRAVFSDPLATTAAAKTICLAGSQAAGTILGFEVGLQTLMSTGGGDDFTVTFDLKNQAGTSLLAAAVTIDKTKAAKTLYPATLATPTLADGNTLYLVITVAGATGTQGLGAFAVLTYDENAQ